MGELLDWKELAVLHIHLISTKLSSLCCVAPRSSWKSLASFILAIRLNTSANGLGEKFGLPPPSHLPSLPAHVSSYTAKEGRRQLSPNTTQLGGINWTTICLAKDFNTHTRKIFFFVILSFYAKDYREEGGVNSCGSFLIFDSIFSTSC